MRVIVTGDQVWWYLDLPEKILTKLMFKSGLNLVRSSAEAAGCMEFEVEIFGEWGGWVFC